MSRLRNIDPKNQVASDVVRFRRELHSDAAHALAFLKKRSAIISLGSILLDWALISVGVYLITLSSAWMPLALILVGSRQRALSNLVHDASHGNLAKSRKLNDILANIFAAWPMGDSVANYRSSHMDHHRFLGQPVADPDFENHRLYGFDDLNPPRGQAVKTYFKILFNRHAWEDSAIGSILTLNRQNLFHIGLWWAVVTITLLFFSLKLPLLAITLWWAARLTTYHCIRIFAEFLDHSGFIPGSILGYTRNIPGAAWPVSAFFHPHADNFHLVHHLLPQIPHYRLRQAHRILMQNQSYQNSHHCDGYFMGAYPAVDSWAHGGRAL
ncbi:MAG: fatty acid desaturase family protein [Pseudobdellovibrionaceae bacterium]